MVDEGGSWARCYLGERVESVEQKNGEGPEWSRQGQGSAQQADVVGFRDQPKLKLARARKIVRASTFNAGWMAVDPAAPFHRVDMLAQH